MIAARKSLRVQVEKWCAATGATPVRVILFSRYRSPRQRCVCVEAIRAAGSLTLFFFHHGDGAWQVFPPEVARPTMNIYRRAT